MAQIVGVSRLGAANRAPDTNLAQIAFQLRLRVPRMLQRDGLNTVTSGRDEVLDHFACDDQSRN